MGVCEEKYFYVKNAIVQEKEQKNANVNNKDYLIV
jgi:hypothetical protein